MKYQTYPKYKPSDTEWLDQIPDYWDEKRLKFLISQKITDGPHETPEFISDGVPFLSVDGIQGDRLVFDGCRYISPENHAQYKIKCFPCKGDILLGKAASVGKVAIVDVDFEFNVWSPLALIRANKSVLPRYIYYSFKANTLQDQILILSTSNTQHNLSMDDIPKLWLTFPNIDEQSKIISFLDRETAKIDEVVAKKQKLIKLLLEKRQAIISQAVTKGLNPKAKMKASGISWIGETPEKWEVKKLKYVTIFNYGESLSEDNRVYIGEIKVFGSNGIVGNHDRSITSGATIVIGRKGSYGQINWSSESCFPIDTTYYIDKRTTNNNLRWLYYLLQLLKLGEGSQDSAVPGLSRESAYEKISPLPEKLEQELIAEYLDQKTKEIDELIKKIETQSQKLQEFRQALISSVVTGKIKI